MKKIYLVKKMYLCCTILSLLQLFSCADNAGKCYYVDASNGDDSNSGISASQAWKSLERVKQITLMPGEKLLLKRGETFGGELEITGKGTFAQPVIVDAYGEGNKPCVVGNDVSLYAVRIFNSDYVTLRNLEIVNTGKQPLPKRTGLKIECRDYGVSRNITVDSLTIRDVNGSLVKELGGGSGIYVVNGGDSIASRFDSLVIENCHILRCTRNAMIWSGYYDRKNWYPSKHTVVRNNLIEEVPGDGIVPIGCDSTLIEYNVMRDCPDVLPMTEAAAGIWPWSCDNTLIWFNEVSGHKAPWDAQGFDCDYNSTNTTIQYNYSHDNYGGMILICDSGERGYSVGNKNSIVSYNISIGDGIRPKETRSGMFSPAIHVAGPVENTLVERNIVHLNAKSSEKADRSMIVSDMWGGYADATIFRENVFYAAEPSRFDMTQSTNNLFSGNWYLGKYTGRPSDETARTSNEVYRQKVLSVDETGYKGLYTLMDERRVGGKTVRFVNKEAIEAFFAEMK
nr:right-handed parallel beta-helix repeat-containing protein [Bacteroides fluxus]